jgi:hypothetical protein
MPSVFLTEGVLAVAGGVVIAQILHGAWIAAPKVPPPLHRLKTHLNVQMGAVLVLWSIVTLAGFLQVLPRIQKLASLLAQVPALVAALIVLALGGALFLFRLKHRAIYGCTEIIVGVLIGIDRFGDPWQTGAALATSTNTVSLALSLSAGVYLVVRGADNVHEGLTNEKKLDPLAMRLIRYMRKPASVAADQQNSAT